MKVAAYQAPYRPYPSPGGAELVAAQLDACHAAGVELLCCPEALLGELANESDGDSPAAVALSVDNGALADALAPLLGSPMTIVIGFTERAPSGDLFNAAAVISGGSVVGVYRKTYPGPRSVCQQGSDLPIFWHRNIPFGVLICADAHYVEPAWVLVARGARLLVVPVHGGHRPAKEEAWRPRGTNVLIARAVENAVPLVAADVAGWQGERVCHGTTAIIDNQGSIVVRATPLAEELVIAAVTLEAAVRGGLDGDLCGRSNPSVTNAFRELWADDRAAPGHSRDRR